MTPEELNALIGQGEGPMLEFKESLPSSLARELAALANTQGGTILLGVRDDGTVAGVEDSNHLRARIRDIARKCDPPVQVWEESVGKVLAVHVNEGEVKPVQCRDGFFARQGAMTQKLTRSEILGFFQTEGALEFDRSFCPRFKYPEDFDQAKFDDWFRRSRITDLASTEEMLVNIGVAERTGGQLRLRNAGVLFFAKNVRQFFPDAYITCLMGQGTDKVHILDRSDLEGGVVADIENAMAFIDRNTRTKYRIEGLQRENIKEYPMKALREAVTNAVMHRDWYFTGSNVFVEVYVDRIEVISPGKLPPGVTLSNIGRTSRRRNPLIADLLHRIDFIEKAGTGIRRIREEAKEMDCPEPEFEADHFITITFHPNPEVRTKASTDQDTDQVDPKTDQVQPPTDQVTVQVTDQVHPKTDQVSPKTDQVTDQVDTETDQVQPPTDQDTDQVSPQTVQVTDQDTDQVQPPTDQVTDQVSPQTVQVTDQVTELLAAIAEEATSEQLRKTLNLKHKGHFRTSCLLPALKSGLIEMTIPEKPKSSKQRYRLTPKGQDHLQRTRE